MSYDAGYALNNVATTDTYTAANSLTAPGARRFRFEVFNNAIFWQLGFIRPGAGSRSGPAIRWSANEYRLAPARGSLRRTFDAIRIRSAVAGSPAQATIEARP
jgi:hypothetical protein